jgi:hypothetical protein
MELHNNVKATRESAKIIIWFCSTLQWPKDIQCNTSTKIKFFEIYSQLFCISDTIYQNITAKCCTVKKLWYKHFLWL